MTTVGAFLKKNLQKHLIGITRITLYCVSREWGHADTWHTLQHVN